MFVVIALGGATLIGALIVLIVQYVTAVKDLIKERNNVSII
jgi:hypothetical protein